MSFDEEIYKDIPYIVRFLSSFYPDTNTLGVERDFNYFTIFLGFNYENSNTLNDIQGLSLSAFQESNIVINEIKDNIYYCRAKETSDNYFTPNIFLQKLKNQKTIENLAWLTSLYVDIDGIDGVTSIDQARRKIYALCRKEGIKKPNYIIHTSTNPFIHVQLFWLIDPLYVYNRPENLSWWIETATALSEKFKSDLSFHVDTKVSRNPAGYMRIPFTFNQKTNHQVIIADSLLACRRFTLQDPWLYNLRKKYRTSQQERINSWTNLTSKLLEHPQIKMLLGGVPKRFRNLSQYAIAKCCYADGLSIEEAINVVLEQNHRCINPEKDRKVIDVTNRAYGIYGPEKNCLYNIDSNIVAEIVNGAFNTQFKADPQITSRYKSSIHRDTISCIRQSQPKKISRHETVRRVVHKVLMLQRQGKMIESQEHLSRISNVKYDSLKHYMQQINAILGAKKLILLKTKNKLSINWLCNDPIVLKGVFAKKLAVATVETGGNPGFGLSQGLVGNLIVVVHYPGSFNSLTFKLDKISPKKDRSPT